MSSEATINCQHGENLRSRAQCLVSYNFNQFHFFSSLVSFLFCKTCETERTKHDTRSIECAINIPSGHISTWTWVAAVAANILFYLTHGLFMFFQFFGFEIGFSLPFSFRSPAFSIQYFVRCRLWRYAYALKSPFFFSSLRQRRVFRVCWRAITCPRKFTAAK